MKRAVLLALTLGGCGQADMADQAKLQTWDQTDFFANETVMQAPVAGTVPHRVAKPASPPATITQALLERGQERYEIFCTPCHGRTGDGRGMIVARGFPPSPPFQGAKLRDMSASHVVDVITHGYGAMYSFADRVPPADRWAIAAYVQALQLSQDADAGSLAAEDRAQLDAKATKP